VSLLLLTLLFLKIDFTRVTQFLQGADPSLVLACLGSYILLFLLLSYRWQLLLNVLSLKVPIQKLYGAYLIGTFFNNFLPTSIGGDMVRGLDLYRHTKKGKEIVVSVLVERLLGYTSQLIIAAAALVIVYPSFYDPWVTWVIIGATAAYAAILALLLTPPLFVLLSGALHKLTFHLIGPRLLEVPKTIALYTASPWLLLQTVLISLIIQTCSILIYYVLTRALHLTIPLADLFLFFPMINIITMIPISLGGLGLREGVSIYLLQKVGVDLAHAMGLSLAWYLILVGTSALGGVIFALRNVKRFPPSTPTPDTTHSGRPQTPPSPRTNH
jgi:uncharacterized membrane protein YbhN (UPF0104 family)